MGLFLFDSIGKKTEKTDLVLHLESQVLECFSVSANELEAFAF